MTNQEMKNLKVGDLVEDMELYKKMNMKQRFICKVIEADSHGVAITSIDEQLKHHYPHRFSFDEANKLNLL